MKQIEDIDKNFLATNSLSRTNIKAYNVCEEPFKVFGLMLPKNDKDCFRRLPYDVAKNTNEGVEKLSVNTAGGRVRFATDSDYIAIRVQMHCIRRATKMSITGCAGFDMYGEEDGVQKFITTFVPSVDVEDGYEAETVIRNPKMREYTINLPLYSGIWNMSVILSDNATVKQCKDYTYKKPILYYGSSITNGGCASRPGNTYQSILSRRLDSDYINLGFSGSAKAEQTIADYIAQQDMSIFVYDYDHNAPTVEYLEETHEKMYKIIRKKQPNLPIVCISRPCCFTNEEDAEKRRMIIMRTVENAKASGDTNVYFIDGKEFYNELGAGDSMSVDGCHPNDLGFMCMANVIEKPLKTIL